MLANRMMSEPVTSATRQLANVALVATSPGIAAKSVATQRLWANEN